MPVIEKFEINKTGFDYVIGDIHGEFSKVDALLVSFGFDKTKDRLFCVGDMIDRGPESHLFLDWLKQPWFFSVRGNHEQMLIGHYLNDSQMSQIHLHNGGLWYGEWNLPQQTREEMYHACLRLPYVIEIETPTTTIGIIHADTGWEDDWVSFKKKIEARCERTRQVCLWSRIRCDQKLTSWITGVSKVYAGHTPDHTVRTYGNLTIIDTGGCFKNGEFTIMRIE